MVVPAWATPEAFASPFGLLLGAGNVFCCLARGASSLAERFACSLLVGGGHC